MTEARLQRIEDRDALRDLLARYCYLIAAGDVEGVLELFAPDCSVEILGQSYEGFEGLRKLYADSLVVEPKPYVHNHLVENLGDDMARGRSVFEIRQTRDGKSETGGGCYEDIYRKIDGSWKFQSRVFRVY